MHIIVATSGYPKGDNPEFSFVGELVGALADLGHECEVIAPFSLSAWIIRRHEYRPYCWISKSPMGNEIMVHQPRYISLSRHWLTGWLRNKCISSMLRRIAKPQSVLYAHFWNNAIAMAGYANSHGNSLLVATGESRIPEFSPSVTRELRDTTNVVIAVSTKNKLESVARGLCRESSVTVLPNAVADVFFEDYDKTTCRKILGLPSDCLIALFIGHFDERKGSTRTDEALTLAGGVRSVFLGAGSKPPIGEHCVFCGRVPHDLIPIYLAASDMFVLPTRAEGCSNAIVEALAVGVPVISSDRDFNYDVLDNDCSLMVDPDDVNEIANAISRLRDDAELRGRLSAHARERGKSFRLDSRALRISKLLENAATKSR